MGTLMIQRPPLLALLFFALAPAWAQPVPEALARSAAARERIEAAQAVISAARADIAAAEAAIAEATKPAPPPPPTPALPNVRVTLHGVTACTAALRDATLHEKRGTWSSYRHAGCGVAVWFWHRFEAGEHDYLARVEPGQVGVRLRYEVADDSGTRASGEADFGAYSGLPLSWPLRASGGETPLPTPRAPAWPLVPPYKVTVAESLLASLPQAYTPGMQGLYPGAIGTTGYHQSIGPLPGWDAAYLASGDERALRTVVVQALAAGRYPLFHRDPDTHDVFILERFPLHTLDSGRGRYEGQVIVNMAPAAGVRAPGWKVSHHPSVGYLAAQLTGWPFLADVTAFAAVTNHLINQIAPRQGARGILRTDVGANVTRGVAWGLRTLRQAAILFGPESQYAKVYASNADYYYETYVANPNANPLGFVATYGDRTDDDNLVVGSWWMDDFLTGEIATGCANWPTNERLCAFAHWKARAIVGRLGDPKDQQAYPYMDAAQYHAPVAVGTASAPTWFSSFGDLWAATMEGEASRGTGALRGTGSAAPTSATGYWANLLPAITGARLIGVTGADAAWTRLSGASNFGGITKGFGTAPVWAVMVD